MIKQYLCGINQSCTFGYMKYFFKYIFTLVFFFGLASCSVRKDRFTHRFFHRYTGWFNPLFNGEEALKKELKKKSEDFKEDYSTLLPVLPGQWVKQRENDSENPEATYITHKKNNFFTRMGGGIFPNQLEENDFSGNPFEYAEQKAIKTIENHSMIISGKERNVLIAKAYLLLGKARYYQGKSYEALDAFNYILDNIKGSKQENEAYYWQARANFQAGNKFYALESLINRYKNPSLTKELKEQIAALYSQILIDDRKYELAIQALEKAKENTKNKKREGRYTFIQAQLQNQLGNYIESSKLFDKVAQYHSGFEMEFQSKMGIAQNFIPQKSNYAAFQEVLKKMLNNSKYDGLKDQIYYQLGWIAEKSSKLNEAEKFFKKGLLQNSSSERIKSLSYAHTGNILFEKEIYISAGEYYDSAFKISKNKKIKDFLGQRRIYLNELVKNYKKVKNNDSILELVRLTPALQRNYVEKYIARLKKEDKKKQQAIEQKITNYELLEPSFAFDKAYDNKKVFYFYNDRLMARGKQKFKEKWGARQLVDDWRTSGIITGFSSKEKQEKLPEEDKTKRYNPDTYLSKIPMDPKIIAGMKSERDSVQFTMGIIYLDKIKNKKKSIAAFKELLVHQPEKELKAKAYYNLFRALQDHPEQAKQYKALLIEEFPQSLYAAYVKNPVSNAAAEKNSKESIALYEKAFKAYISDDYEECKRLVNKAFKNYEKQEIIAKFSLLSAYAEGKTQGKEAMLSALEKVALLYKGVPEADKAEEILRLSRQKKDSAKNRRDST